MKSNSFLIFLAVTAVVLSTAMSELVESDEYEKVECRLVERCHECSFVELREITVCMKNTFVQRYSCVFRNIRDPNDVYEEQTY